jgi:hypothetical protein
MGLTHKQQPTMDSRVENHMLTNLVQSIKSMTLIKSSENIIKCIPDIDTKLNVDSGIATTYWFPCPN